MTGQDTTGRLALVTGASSGIGAATAHQLCAAGWSVHAMARREDRLRQLADATGCTTHVVDVTDADAISDAVAKIGPVDVLVNNAGLGRGMTGLADTSYADIERSVGTNVTAALHLIQLVLPGMIARRRGHIVNLGSMAGTYALPAALYGATKSAIHRLSTNLRLELEGTGVRVTEINPGRVKTEFYDVAIDDPELRAKVQNSGVDEVTADDVADTIMYAITRPLRVNINRIEIQPLEQTYGGSQFVPTEDPG